ncbi:unnamed protein product [Camellia sinensis]
MFKLLSELRSLVSNVAIIVCVCMSLLNQASEKTGLVATAATTITTATLGGNDTDYLALLSIKAQITNDPMLVTSSWNDSLYFCLWEGVLCGRCHQRVIGLSLESRYLEGSISTSIGNLTFLIIVDLSNNNFQGEIPHEMGRLFKLQVLNLTHNLLEGQIPANLSSCNNLKRLSLGYNKFIGNLPIELGSLNQLVQLYMNSNNLSGAIPPSFGNLSSLKLFSISENVLEGSIPDSLGSLKSLRYLSFSSNKISGMIPPSIYNISSLTALEARVNLLEGSLPQNLGLSLPNIKRVNIAKNHLSGSIPLSISNASKLEHLILSMNKLYPGVAVNFENLKILLFEDGLGTRDANDLNFILSLVNCSKLRTLSLDSNNFGGVLPNSLVNLSTQLQSLSVYNRLTGTIPTSIGKLHKIQELGFGKNKFSGEIPSSIGNWTLVNQLYLILLHLYGNNLSGIIPREVIGISSLSKSLDLSRNSLTGPIPPEVSSLKTLVELNLSYNKLSGNIPSSLGSCDTLVYLFLDNNSLGGTIPQSLSSLKAIEELGLSHNNLSEGEVPVRGVFQNATTISISGNNKLCRVFGMRKQSLVASSLTDSSGNISYGDLLKAMNGFSSDNLIGTGSFGSVYKGILHPNETTIAVKVIEQQNIGASKSFLAECKALRNIRHRNIIKIISACASVDFQGNDFHKQNMNCSREKRPTDGMFKDGLTLHKLAKLALLERVMEIVDEKLVSVVEEEETASKNSRREMRRGKFVECLILILCIGVACSVESPRERMTIVDAAMALHLVKDMLLGRRISSNVQIASKGAQQEDTETDHTLLSREQNRGEIPLAQNLSNLIRLVILYKYGGVHLDTDFITLKDFSRLRNSIEEQSIDATGRMETGRDSTHLKFTVLPPMAFYPG